MDAVKIKDMHSFISLVDMFRQEGCDFKPFNDGYITKQGKPTHYGIIAPEGSILRDGQPLVAELFCEGAAIGHNAYVEALIAQHGDYEITSPQSAPSLCAE